MMMDSRGGGWWSSEASPQRAASIARWQDDEGQDDVFFREAGISFIILGMNEFVDAILKDPDSIEPRLIYADYLASAGNPRGHFIRLQCEIEKQIQLEDCEVLHELKAEEQELLIQHRDQWEEEFRPHVISCSFVRGMIESVTINAGDFLEHGQELLSKAPIDKAWLVGLDRQLVDELAKCGLLLRLRRLSLEKSQVSLNPILASNYLGNVERLILEDCNLTCEALIAIAESRTLSKLEDLELQHNRIRNRGVIALADSPNARQLNYLGLAYNEVRLLGARALAESNHLDHMRGIDLTGNKIPKRGVDQLRARFGSSCISV